MLRVLTLSTLFPDATRPNFGIYVEQQTRGLAGFPDIEVRVVAPLGVPPWPLCALSRHRSFDAVPEHETWRGLDVRRPRFVELPGSGRFHATMLARALVPLLKRLRRDFPFDLIDAEFFFPDGPAAVALGRRFGVPVSIKARGGDIDRWGRRPGVGAQVIAAGKAADGLLAVSESMRREMIALGLPEHIEVSSTGVDQRRFAPRDRAAARARFGIAGPLVVSLGALIPLKGHDILVDAVSGLPGVSLLIAGVGPEHARLEAQIARRGLGDRNRLLGPVPHAEIPELLAAADVMALASSSEGLANAWVESLACGTPIVIPDVGGARELLLDQRAGRIVERTPEAFRAAIAALLADPPPPDLVTQAARRFTWEANAHHLRGYFQRMVDRRSR